MATQKAYAQSRLRFTFVIGIVVVVLFAALPSAATPITLNLPPINQHNMRYDRNAADGNQNGEMWCAPVATVSALLWLSDHYNRPGVVPVGANGKPYSTDEFVVYMGERWLQTSDKAGTNEKVWTQELWKYLSTMTGSRWTMDVYADAGIVQPFDGPTFAGHATVSDLYEEMRSGEDDPGAVVLLAFKHVNAEGNVEKHAAVLQMLDNAKIAGGKGFWYPAAIMDPYKGAVDNAIRFDATKDLDTPALLYDYVDWRDVYLAIAVEPVPEPSTLAMVTLALLVASLLTRRVRGRQANPAGVSGRAWQLTGGPGLRQ